MSAAAPPTANLPDTTEVSTDATALITQVKALVIETPAQFAAAGVYLVKLATLRKRIQDVFREPKAAADKAHKAITKAERDLLAGPQQAEQTLRGAMGEYQTALEQQRRTEQARLAAEATAREKAAREAQAEALADAGDVEAGLALLDAPVVPVAVTVEAQKVDGVSFRRVWQFEVYDQAAVKPAYLVPDLARIKKQVEALGADAAAVVGGIRVWEEQIPVVRT